MCGLAGGNFFDEETLNKALELMAHRGRDARAARCYDRVWLGHNRLAIQDLSRAADQPYEFDGGSLVFNGELWKNTMVEYGGGCTSDTALLAAMYEEYGDDLVDLCRRLDGMFAFAVYDERRGRVVLARDWLGRIPLYYVMTHKGIAFASEAKALTEPLGFAFAGNNRLQQNRSHVKLFPPGCVATYSLTGTSWVRQEFRNFDCYQDLSNIDGADMGLEYYATGLRDRLVAAVDNESVADVPVCTILSGGVDSTLITAILTRQRRDVVAYTVSVGGSIGKDDLLYARYAAAVLGVELREVVLTREEVAAALGDAVWAVEDNRWVQVAPAVPQIALARHIGADGFKVVFGGEGADELFASYADTKRWYWEPALYHPRRLKLTSRLHDNNLIRGNKACMWGGTVELRTPFLDRAVVDFALRIPTKYRADLGGAGRHVKWVLREGFRGWVPDPLLMRPKVTFQEGAHSDFLKERKGEMKATFDKLFNLPQTAQGRAGRLR